MLEYPNSLLRNMRSQMENKFNLLCMPRKSVQGLSRIGDLPDAQSPIKELKSMDLNQDYSEQEQKVNECSCSRAGQNLKFTEEQEDQQENPMIIQTLKIFEKLDYSEQKRIKVVAKSFLSAYPYILFSLSVLERQNYPHLFTLIKQHFYRPGMFQDFQSCELTLQSSRNSNERPEDLNQKKEKKILQMCANFFEKVADLGNDQSKPVTKTIQKHLQDSSLFIEVCLHILTKILKGQSKSEEEFKNQTWMQEIKLLCKKFNIDSCEVDFNQNFQLIQMEERKSEKCLEILSIGLNRIFYMVCEHSSIYYILETDSNSKQKKSKNFNKKAEYKNIENQQGAHSHEISEREAPNLVEVSEESTPKFKDNQESIRYRRRSHKNSFGGDMDIFNYHDLSHKLYKGNQKIFGQFQNSNEKNMGQKKVFSERFQAFEMSPLTVEDQTEKAFQNNISPIQTEAFKTAMRQSHIDGRGFKKQAKIKQERLRKESKLSSSQILQINTRFKESLESKESNKYLTQNMDSNNLSLEAFSQEKQIQFKMSFSPKDADRYQMTDNQNQYQLIKNPSSEFQKKELYKSAIKYEMQPIVEEAQSSQQQDKKQQVQVRNSEFENEEKEQNEQNQDQEFFNIFNNRMKNRKFSYLTQPITPGKRQSQIITQEVIQVQKKPSQKVFKIQKLHKNSQAITEGSPKVRFEENPISFSQIMADEEQNFVREEIKYSPSNKYIKDLNLDENRTDSKKLKKKLNYQRNVINFASGSYYWNKQSKQSGYIYKQPKGWYKKQTIYYFQDKAPQKFTIQKFDDYEYSDSRDEKYCFKKNKKLKHFKTINALRWESQENDEHKSKDDDLSIRLGKGDKQSNGSVVKNTEKSVLSKKSPHKKVNHQQTFIRSTIDTQILSASPVVAPEQIQKHISKTQTVKNNERNANKKESGNKFFPRDSKSSKRGCPSIHQENEQTLNSDRNPSYKPKFIPSLQSNSIKDDQLESTKKISSASQKPSPPQNISKLNGPKFLMEKKINPETHIDTQRDYMRNISHPNFYPFHPSNLVPPPSANSPKFFIGNNPVFNYPQQVPSQKIYTQPNIVIPSHDHPTQNPIINLYGSYPSIQSGPQFTRKSTSQPKIQRQKPQNSKQPYVSPGSFTSLSSCSPKFEYRHHDDYFKAQQKNYQNDPMIKHLNSISPTHRVESGRFPAGQRVQANSFNNSLSQRR